MKTTDNTILITGGGSGIGRGLAEAFHALGNQVIISGRTQAKLDETCAANPGMKALTVDLTDPADIRKFAAKLLEDFPALDAVIHNAGLGIMENLLESGDTEDAETMIATNLLGPIRLNAALLPTLLKQPHATILTVSSGLAMLPLAIMPTYNSTKAAIHSWTQSLRYQLKETNVQVIEIIPPYVATEFGGDRQANDPHAMPLKDFISETMDILKNHPERIENCVERVMPLRLAGEINLEKYEAFFHQFNDQMSAHFQEEK